jgi:hypothetical protein
MILQSNENASETWRLVVVRGEGDEVLVTESSALPEVGIPMYQRIAANINRAVERDLGLRVVSLYELHSNVPGQLGCIPYHAVAAVERAQKPRAGARWTAIGSLTNISFACPQDFDAVRTYRSKLDAAPPDGAEPFLKPDWFSAVVAWVEKAARESSLRLTGEFHQLNASETFSLIRFETDRTPVWFKAVGDPNLREYGVTHMLAAIAPSFVPRMLGSSKEWNAWLSLESGGRSLASQPEIGMWETTAARLANLQIATLNHSKEIVQAGARDVRVPQLRLVLDPFFAFVGEAIRSSRGTFPEDVSLHDISELHETAAAVLDTFADGNALDTVGHMDLSPNNIVCESGRAVFLDWAEGFVGAPTFSFEYLLQHFRQVFPKQQALEDGLRSAYLVPWHSLGLRENIEQLCCLSPFLALFAYATTLWSASTWGTAQDADRKKYLLGLVRRMRTEARRTCAAGASR